MPVAKAGALETLKKTLASPGSNPDDERGVGGDESVPEALSKNIFSNYVPSCSAITRGVVHPGWHPVFELRMLPEPNQDVDLIVLLSLQLCTVTLLTLH